jgi:hypothetical protein
MLAVRLPATFDAERIYAIDVLLGELLGLSYQLWPEDRTDYCLELPNGHTLSLADAFFGACAPRHEYLDAANIPAHVARLTCAYTAEPECPVLFGTNTVEATQRHIRLGADIVAGAFFMLTRWEESVQPKLTDQHGRALAETSTAYRHGFLHRPIVNEYAELLWNCLVALGITQPRRTLQYKVVPTHDVDNLLFWSNLPKTAWVSLRRLLGSDRYNPYLQRGSRPPLADPSRATDPYNTYHTLMGWAEAAGTTAHFFFKATRHSTRYDKAYALDDGFARNLIGEITRRGHVVGFHPGYATHLDPKLWREEYQRLQDVCPQPIRCGRQHFLRFDAPQTWELWEDFNMVWDSSCCYPYHAGFRAGICHSFPVFNVFTRQKIQLRERPLIAMETGFFLNREELVDADNLSPEYFHRQWTALRDTVRRYHGEFVFNWHNSSIVTPRWQPYVPTLREVLLP